jgi:hypothetical protein
MITPAVLISATGMLILSTSNRLARIVEQTRTLGAAMEQLSNGTRPARRITTPPQITLYKLPIDQKPALSDHP